MNEKISRIVLVNVWHDDNKGDGGIAEGVLRLLKSKYPKAEFGVVSMFPKTADAFQNAHRHLESTFPDIEIASSPFPAHDPSKSGGILRQLKKLWQVPLSILQLLFPFFSPLPAVKMISNADLVIANGGQYLFTQEKYFNSLFTVYRLLYPLLIAWRFDTPYMLFSQSFGFHEKNWPDNWLVRTTLNHALETWAREEISLKNLAKLGIDESKLRLVPDAAFVLEPVESQRVSNILKANQLEINKFWAITVRQWSSFTNSFLDEIEDLIRESLASGLTSKIALVAHTQGPSVGGDDRVSTSELFSRFEGESSVVMVDDDLTPGELVSLYRESELMIGTRFHSVIFSLVAGTPAYAVSYAGPKTWGIMRMLEIEYLCSDMKSFDASTALSRIKASDLKLIRSSLPSKIKNLSDQLNKGMDDLDMQH